MAPRIESYSFGKIEIDGERYTNDVIITPSGVIGDWWRKDGHSLEPADIEKVLDEIKPEVLVIGRGANGVLTVPDSTRKWIEDKGIAFEALPSEKACDRYNEIKESKKVVAGLHLTC